MQKSAKLYRAAGPLLGNVGEKLGSGLLKKNQTQFSSVLEMQFESKSACVDLPRGLQKNPSEGNNKVVQDFVCNDSGKRRVNELEFARSLQKLIQRQQKNLELAVINQGPHKHEYEHLAVGADDWIKMSKQKDVALKKIHQQIVVTPSTSMEPAPPTSCNGRNPLLNEIVNEGIDWIPFTTLEGITRKAEAIIKDKTMLEIPNSNQ